MGKREREREGDIEREIRRDKNARGEDKGGERTMMGRMIAEEGVAMPGKQEEEGRRGARDELA